MFYCTATDHASTDTTTVCCMLTLSGALLAGPQKMVGESQCPVSKHVTYGSPPFTTHPGARHVATHRDSNSVPCNTHSLATHRDSNSVPCNTARLHTGIRTLYPATHTARLHPRTRTLYPVTHTAWLHTGTRTLYPVTHTAWLHTGPRTLCPVTDKAVVTRCPISFEFATSCALHCW